MIEEGIRRRICHVIHRYANENNKYMKNYNKDKESVYLMYWDANNFYGCAMTQKLLINSLQWEKMHLSLMRVLQKDCNENSDK